MGRKRKPRPILEDIFVESAGAKGKAVGTSKEGIKIFIEKAVPGDVVDIEIVKKRKSYFQAKVLKYKTLSNKRTEAACKHFGLCGGCKWQNMSYDWQLHYKEEEVKNNLQRIGKLDWQATKNILGSEDIFYYRNKMEFSFSSNRWLTHEEIQSNEGEINRNGLGFHLPGMWDKILDIDDCLLQQNPSNQIRNAIKSFAIDNGLSFFHPRKQEGLLRTLMVRSTLKGSFMVLIQFFENKPTEIQKLMRFIQKTFPNIDSLLYTINTKANDTLYDQEILVFSGQDHIIEEMEDLQFKINAKSFYQTNSKQAYNLYKIVRDMAGLTGAEFIYDLYTGTGTIALFLAKQAKMVLGIESVPEAIEMANDNAQNNQIDNVHFITGDMKTELNEVLVNTYGLPGIIVTDPPRDGMHPKVVDQLLQMRVPKIIYVSCNSATQARDLFLLKEHYEIKDQQAVDMFPHTHHVENVVLLELKKREVNS